MQAILGFVLLVLFVIGTGSAGAADDFYKGKKLRMIVSSSPGGGNDTYTRLIARHIKKHIPGNPTLIVQNMSGAGGLLATHYLYSKARRNGTVMGQINWGTWDWQVIGDKRARFDFNKMNAIGVAAIENRIIYRRKDRFKTLDHNIKTFGRRGRLATVGISGPRATGNVMGNILEVLRGEKLFQYVSGYTGTRQVSLAFRQGDVDVSGNSHSSFMNQLGDMWKDGNIIILAQTGTADGKKSPEFSDAPLLAEMAKTPQHKDLVRATFLFSRYGYPYSMPPGVPADRVAIMRAAFDKTMKDPAFLAEAKKLGRPILPATGAELQKMWKDLLAASPEDVAIIKRILTDTKEKPTVTGTRGKRILTGTKGIFTPSGLPRTSGAGLPSPMDPLGPIKQPAQPRRATTTGSGVVVSAATIGANPTKVSPPPAVKHEYDSSEHLAFIEKCEPAAASIAEFRARYKGKIDRMPDEQFLSVVDEYDTHCLHSVEVLDNILSDSAKTAIQRRVGVLMYRGEPQCNAVRISDRTVLTAYHCLFKPPQAGTVWELRDHKKLRFAAYHIKSREVPISEIHPPHFYSASNPDMFDESRDEYDFVQLTLDSSPDDAFLPRLHIRKPVIYDRLTLLGYQKTLEYAHNVKERQGREPDTRTWRAHFRVDNSATCRVNLVVKGCVAHACQTDFGSSGAPLFAITSSGDLELVALHIRGTSVKDAGSCKHDYSGAFPNLGVYPDLRKSNE